MNTHYLDVLPDVYAAMGVRCELHDVCTLPCDGYFTAMRKLVSTTNGVEKVKELCLEVVACLDEWKTSSSSVVKRRMCEELTETKFDDRGNPVAKVSDQMFDPYDDSIHDFFGPVDAPCDLPYIDAGYGTGEFAAYDETASLLTPTLLTSVALYEKSLSKVVFVRLGQDTIDQLVKTELFVEIGPVFHRDPGFTDESNRFFAGKSCDNVDHATKMVEAFKVLHCDDPAADSTEKTHIRFLLDSMFEFDPEYSIGVAKLTYALGKIRGADKRSLIESVLTEKKVHKSTDGLTYIGIRQKTSDLKDIVVRMELERSLELNPSPASTDGSDSTEQDDVRDGDGGSTEDRED